MEVLPPSPEDDDKGRVSYADGCAELDEIAVDRADAVLTDPREVEQQPVVLQDIVSIEGLLTWLLLMNGQFVDRTAVAVVGTQQTDRGSVAARPRSGFQEHDPPSPQDGDGGVPALRLDEQAATRSSYCSSSSRRARRARHSSTARRIDLSYT